jgi:lysophospholipase L1-like esterase
MNVDGNIIQVCFTANSGPTRRVEIVGDSHLIGCATNMYQFLKSNYSVSSLTKPGAPISELTGTQGEVFNDLKKNDVIVLCGGANDLNNEDGTKDNEVVKQITNFTQTHNHTNILIIGIPHRFDLNKDSGINQEIRKINAGLRELSKSTSHVLMLEIDPSRDLFTNQGLHLNKLGKEALTKSIANLINQELINQIEPNINETKAYATSLILKEAVDENKSSQKTGGKDVCTFASNFSGYEAVINNVRKKRGSTLDKAPSTKLRNDSCTLSGNPPGTGTENNNAKKETRSSQEKPVSNDETSVSRPNQERQVITNNASDLGEVPALLDNVQTREGRTFQKSKKNNRKSQGVHE